ncbi:Beta-1,2-xylosyltransferase 1 [Pseudocercospora fuligena]|uniref:Beta-1,2-xylosyltransferase 1 n=1 Tax=Pseudocercospora fuligena TaxID=685502 RepID=A0A8H6RP42_9PEZI|nr:Beta-1,2-xylosyltransferase 1 [Pseudocercospora fuligena]
MLISAASIHSRLVQLAIATTVLIGVAWFLVPTSYSLSKHLSVPHVSNPISTTPTIKVPPKVNHPIDQLTRKADEEYKAILAKETKDVHSAAEEYRKRRGRQPPPLFDVWFEYSKNNSAIIVEDFFDRIYDDLNAFWGVPAKQIREQANDFIHRISVRNGNATGRTDVDRREWIELWKDMVQSVAPWLPDVDLPINVMDESRIVVPFEEIDGYMKKSRESRKIVPSSELKTTFGNLRDLDKHAPPQFDAAFAGEGPYWSMAVVGCPPDSPARKAYIETDFTRPPPLSTEFPRNTFHGYVQNWTFAQDPCEHPSLQGLHGTFVEPISISNSRKFFPMFGGSKLPMNNEILLPPAMYWTSDPFYSGGDDHGGVWKEKKDRLIWRGSASGGRNKAENWTRFQRHRFVSMINATSIKQYEQHPDQKPINFVLPGNNTYDLAVQNPEAPATAFSDWVKEWSDAAVVHLLCFPGNDLPTCPYTDQYFFVEKAMPMKEQYSHKYLPDIDGNSFSGRYRGFLGSTSLPIKATIYQEWHDSRLVPWKHFVPMDNTFIDIYGIMEYFVGNKKMGLEGHDDVARNIALEGKSWAEKVLRKEDMSVYVFRLLLEFARLCDDDREKMGWAEKENDQRSQAQAGVT